MQRAADQHQGAVYDYLNRLGGSVTQPSSGQMTGAPKMDFRTWYSGQNLDGPQNGWDTDFQKVFQSGMSQAYEQGRVFDYFTQDKATGVVTWDNARGKGDQRFTFGDVVVDGERVGNVYQDFDRHTANVMMGDYLIETGARKAELNEAGDVEKAWEEELRRIRTENTQKAEVAPRAKAFEEGVREELETDDDRGKIVASGAAGGAIMGAGIGSFFTPLGTAIGAAAGGVIGGLGAWLNSDSLTYQLARSQEQLKYAKEEGAGIQATMSMLAQNTMSIGMSPVQNLLQGTYDAMGEGGVGGGTLGGDFHKVNEVGEREAGFAWQAADLIATIGDSALQFSSVPARLAYQAQMTTQIGAGVIGLMPGQGQWDQRLVRQNSVWTRDEYNTETGQWEQKFDLGNALAGIGNVGIDAVQLGAWSSLSRQTDRLAGQVAKRTGTETSRWAKPFGGNTPFERLNLSSAQRKALREGAEIETRSGFKFVVSESGEIVGRQRATLAMLAPSEGLQAMSAKLLARRDAARRSGAVTAEDLYQAASDLALGQRGLQAMLVNAVGEAQEEVAQAFLEPWSQDHKVDAEEVMRAGLAGAASGFGMTAGARMGRPSQDLQMYAVGRLAHAAQTNGAVLSYDEWNQMNHLQKRTLVKSASGLAKALTDSAFEKIENDRINGVVGGVVEAAAAEDYWRAEDESALKNGAAATDQAAPIVMHESYTFRPEAIATSHTQLLVNQQDRTRGGRLQLEELSEEVAKARAAATGDPQNQELASRLARLEAQRNTLEEVVAESERLEATIGLYVEAIDDAFARDDNAAAESMIDGLNSSLEAMFDMTTDTVELAVNGRLAPVRLTDAQMLSLSKAVSRLATRDPADSTGSWQVMLPQVHKVFAFRGADGVYGVSQIILKAIRGDYDGDKMRQLQQVILRDEDYVRIRSGENILGVEAMPEIASTKFEQAVAARVMQVWDSTNEPMRQAARKIALDIEADLKQRYHNDATGVKPISLEVIADVTAKVQDALANGGDVRGVVLETMSRRAGGALQEVGRGRYAAPGLPKLSNEMFWLANTVTRRMQEFQSFYAEHTPNKGVPDDRYVTVAPSQTRTDVRQRTPLRGATPGQTAAQELPGSNYFRMFQKMHYTLWETTDKYAGFDTEIGDSRYQDLVEFYERLSQGVTAQRLERKSPSDQIIGQVMQWLEMGASDPTELQRLGLTELGDMALMANVAVGQMIYKEDGNGNRRLWYTGKQVTMAQHLLYLSLEKFKRQNALVWDKDTDLRAAYNNLLELTKPPTQGDRTSFPGNPEMAFVRIFEGARLFDLVGVDAVSLGVNRTVGQVYRELLNLSVPERKQAKYRAHTGRYQDGEPGFTIPFGSKELEARAVTSYKSLVDSLFSAADSSLSQNLTGKDKGKVHGRFAKQSNERGQLIRDTYADVQALLRRLEPKTGKYTAEDISRIANENREFGRALMKTIPPSAMPWVIKRQEPGGEVVFSKWFYEVWAQPSAEQAEMSYFRNLVLDSWYAKVRALDIDFTRGEDATQKRIAFDSLDSRMHQLIFRLASRSVVGSDAYDPFSLKAFLAKFDQAQSVEKFMAWVNSEDALVVEGAPLLPWMDDVAVFDPVRAGGGWSNQLTTPALMESINDLRSTARRIIKDTDKAAERSRQDVQTALAIERWHKHLQNPDDQDLLVSTRDGDEATYNRFVALLERAAQRRMANGPRSMVQHTSHLVYGMYAPAHAKGEIPEQMAANAALEALDNAIGYLTPAERVLGDLTTHNEDAVAQAPQMLLRDGGRTMTRYGSTAKWQLNSVEAMLPLMLNSDHHNLMRSVLFDTVIELDPDNVARRKFLMGSTLDEVLKQHTVKDLFDDEGGSPGLTKAMQFLVKLESELRDSQKHEIAQKVTELVLARTTALDRSASFEEIQSMTVQAYLDFATVIQTVARTRKTKGEEDPAVVAHRMLKEAALVSTLANAYNIDPEIVKGRLDNLQPLVELEVLQPYADRLERILDQLQETGISADTRARLDRARKSAEATYKAMQVKVSRMFDLNVTDEIVAQYSYSEKDDPAKKHARQTELMEYVYEHGEAMQAAGPALLTVMAIKNHFGETGRDRKIEPLKLPEKDWETLANVIISVEIQRLLTVGPASKPPPPYPAPLKDGVKGLDKRKYWDHSFSYLFDFLSEDDTTGIVAAARRLATDSGMLQAQFGVEEIVTKVRDRFLAEGTLGTWTAEVPIQSIESYELLTGASAKPSISMHGLISQRWGAAMEATKRRFDTAAADSTVTLTWRDLDWHNTGPFHDVTVTRDDGRTFERPVAQMNNRFASELTFSYSLSHLPGAEQYTDLMKRPNVARLFLPAADEPGGSDLREVNIDRLAEEIELILRQQHPGLDAEQMAEMLRSVEVTMKFVSPDSQPADEAYANNVWHEGTVYDSAGDTHDSLLEAFFYGIGALNARGQQAALDTRKLGLMGIEDLQRPRFERVLEIEQEAGTDFARMLALKTKELMDTPISNGKPVDVQLFNAAYKIMKLKHWVDGVDRDTNERVRWSAEQVIAWQMNPENTGKDFFSDPSSPLREAELWIPSDQVLADMMGDIGYGGVRGRALKREVTDDLTTIRQYTSRWSDSMEEKFPVKTSSVPTTLTNTDVALQSYVQDLRASTQVTPQERMRFQRRVEAMQYRLSQALQDRLQQAQRPTFDPAKNRERNMDRAIDWVAASDVKLKGLPAEMRYLEREHGDMLERTLRSLQTYMDEQYQRGASLGSSFWIFQETGTSSIDEGLLMKGDLTGKLSIVPGEVVFFDTAGYQNMDPEVARKKAMERIDFFVNRGAALMIGSSDGPNHLNSELQQLTQSRYGYQRYLNNSSILVPDALDESSFQNVAAARSRLVAPSAVPITPQRLSMLLFDQHVEENTMWVFPNKGRKSKFDAIQAVFDPLPIDVHAQFNTAVTRDDALQVQRHLEGLGVAGVEMLRREALRDLKGPERDTAEREFDEAWDRLMVALPSRVQANTTQPLVGEEFGTGDFIPLINSLTGELLLYRHGYRYPKQQDYLRQLRSQTPGDSGVRGIVMYSGERAPNATTHRGTVVSVDASPGRGFRMELEVPVQTIGGKITFEHNGMKYLQTEPKDFEAPEIALFGTVGIDGFASLHDSISKEATDGFVTSFQNAFAVFGIDFTADLKEFFGTATTDEAIRLMKTIARVGEKMSVDEVYRMQSLLAGQDAYLSAISGLIPQLSAAEVDVSKWASKLEAPTANAAIGRAMLMYLMSPNADVDAVLSTSGFHVDNPSMVGARSQKMPELFTRAFDLAAPDSPIKAELSDRINARLNKSGDESWHLDVNSWELEGRTRGGKTIRGLLQYGTAYATEDNVLLNLMAQERKDSQSATRHQGLMNRIGMGGVTLTKSGKMDRLARTRAQDLTDPEQIDSLWHDITFVDPSTYGPGSRWQSRTPAEHAFYAKSIQRFTQYRHAIDLDGAAFEEDRTAIRNGITTVVDRLGLRPSQEDLVHYWIRQMLYHPVEGPDQETFEGDLSPKDVLGAVRAIMDNLDNGYFPTYNGAGPSFFAYDDLVVLFQAYQRGESKWAPSRKERDILSRASSENIGEWISIAFGQAINSSVEFDPIYRLDMSGFMNTYQTVLRNSGYMMDITLDKEYQRKLLDPQTNELLTVTIDPVENNRLTEQVLMTTAGLEYEDLMRGTIGGTDTVAQGVAANWRQRRLTARARWRARNKVRPVKVQSARDFVRNGTEIINRDADMHSLQRIVIALRHGTAMLNPGLYLSMIPEQGFRMYLSEMTNMLTGESTLRTVSGAQRGVAKLTGGRYELNQYSAEQIDQMNKLFSNMGNDGAFTSLIIKDMMWHKPGASPGRAVSFFERYASIGNKWQDPTWGTTQKSMARHYFENIMRAIESMPTRYAMTTDSVIAHLRTDPTYFAREHKDLHQMASNAVVDFRSLKQTPLSLTIKSMYEPWATSGNGLKRFAGTLLKLQAMYATYNANVLTTITGMQGYSDLVSVFFDGRRKMGSWAKMWWKARNGEPITDEDYYTFDMSSVLDGVTIANSFIKGGVTQTGLFMLGMAFGGILSGEDEEAKRRRRLAEAQNAPLIMDPRRLELDFRNKDVIFLDWLPPQLSAFFRVQGDDGSQGARSAAQISWILKPFLSPILGMERFFMTGDFSYVTHGFIDAVGSLPLFNKGKIDDAIRTANELEALAAEEQEAGTPTSLKNTLYLLSSAVAVYESMLVENMFLNSLYTGFDMYDRDPTKLVLRDSDGDIQRTIENNARVNDLALTDFPTEDGVGTGYMKRDPFSASLAAYTENNLTAAAMLSLFKPIHHQEFFRGDMPVRLRKIDMPELTDDEAKVAIILATLNQQKAQGTLERQLSLDEVTKMLRDEILDRKDWDAYHNLDALAQQFYQSDANPTVDPLSVIGKDGQEVLTKSGQAALFKGLMNGTISLDDPEMRGIAISQEQREVLEKEFFEDMTREGRDIGLTQTQAENRAKRLMLGPLDDPTVVGFRDILWDKRIPWDADPKYKQLNTTYVQGPDGFPWATGYRRGGAPGMGGFWHLLGGLKRPTLGSSFTDAISEGGRMNSADMVRGINTGQRGLVPFNETELIPTDWEQTQKIIDAIEDHEVNVGQGYEPNSNGGGRGTFYRSGYGRGGFRRFGGGGGYSRSGYSPTIYWSRQPTLPRGTNVYGNFARNLFWNNANIRRTTIRRERYQSSRGRLKQWQ